MIFTVLPAFRFDLSGLSVLCSLLSGASPPHPNSSHWQLHLLCTFKVPQPFHSHVSRQIFVLFQPACRNLSPHPRCLETDSWCRHDPSNMFPQSLSALSPLSSPFLSVTADLQKLSTKDPPVATLASASERARGTMNNTDTQQRQDPIATPRNSSSLEMPRPCKNISSQDRLLQDNPTGPEKWSILKHKLGFKVAVMNMIKDLKEDVNKCPSAD